SNKMCNFQFFVETSRNMESLLYVQKPRIRVNAYKSQLVLFGTSRYRDCLFNRCTSLESLPFCSELGEGSIPRHGFDPNFFVQKSFFAASFISFNFGMANLH